MSQTLNEQTAQKLPITRQVKMLRSQHLFHYPNPLDEDLQKRQAAIDHLYRLIDAADSDGDSFGNYIYWQNAIKILIREFY